MGRGHVCGGTENAVVGCVFGCLSAYRAPNIVGIRTCT